MKKVIGFLLSVEDFVLWFVVLQMVLLAFIQVILRYVFHSALSWAEELLRFEVVFVAFMGAALGVKYGSHIAVDALYNFSPPRMKIVLKFVSSLFNSAFCFLLFYLAMGVIIKVKASGQTTPAMGIPKYLLYIPIFLGSLIFAIRSTMQFGGLFSKQNVPAEEKEKDL